ncbi:unnamed protein product [Miscanthus lutarioriparius]|uniref:FRIGIDA-like protein n=1 Tax=Miscanthus lutarioriparius TaxID=422564 RepID=A0A811N1P9_9POAL|nr:unnamed protein product [Miscanthus lutarioriparius]
MAQASPDHRDPMAMTVAELEAAIAALPGKRDALREAFDRLAACSPSPLSFAWEDLDGHISSLQSSIALRFRQLRVLEAAGAAPAAAALGGTRGDGKGENQEEELEEDEEEEEVVEVEEEVAVDVEEEEEKKADEEIQEAHSDKICNYEKDGKQARDVEVEEKVAELEKADEEMHEANSNKIRNDEKDTKETREVEVEEVVTELEKKADEEMQEAGYDKICNDEKDRKGGREEVVEEEEVEEAANVKIGNEIKDEKEAREEEQASKVNEQDPDKEIQVVDNDKGGLNTKDALKASQDKEEEDQDTNMDETAAKMASSVQHKEVETCDKKQEQDVHEKVEGAKNVTDQVSSDRGNRAVPCRSDDRTVACTNMDAQRLVELICTNTEFNSEFHAAVRRAPDAAALALHVIELFLHNKIFVKTRKVWASCVGLVQMVPVVVTKPSADTIEQAKRVAKDWKEMIDNPESCNVVGSPSLKKKSTMLLKGLGLGNRIPELMDYLIGNGQQMDVLRLARIFNMVDKYPPLSLLKGYVEKAKQTAMEISQKNMTRQLRVVIIKELDNLRSAKVLAKKEITNSNLCTSIREEINILLGELEKKKRSLADPLTASTSNSQQQQTKSKKKPKIEQEQEHHKGQENQMRGQLSELAEKPEKKQRKPQQEQQQKQEDKLEEKKQKQENEPEEKKQKQEDKLEEKKQKQEDKPEEKKRKQEDKPEEKQQQNKQKHQKRLRQRTHQPPTQGYPAMWNAALRGDLERPPYAAMHGVHHGYPAQSGWPGVHGASPFMPQLGAPDLERPPYAAMHGVHHGYPAQPGWPGVHGASSFMPQLGAPEYIGPFTPLYPRPQFYPR